MPDAGYLALLDQQYASNRGALKEAVVTVRALLDCHPHNTPQVAQKVAEQLVDDLCVHKIATMAATALIEIAQREERTEMRPT